MTAASGMSEAMSSGVNSVLQEALSGEYAYTQGPWEEAQAFYHAVSWSKDKWIFGIFAYEAVVYLTVLICRRHWEQLSIIFGVNTIVLFCMEPLNTFLRENWEAFSAQNYFEKNGSFLMTVLGMPMLICQLIIVILLVSQAVRQMIKVKTVQLRRELAEKAKAEKKKDK
mmetsp:Transcript_44935/g.82055  ORF Transcript_44935/g.82055 Transcript_44935/m.82055 type:complete len:169 (+) Transcript_44935:147-653(+)